MHVKILKLSISMDSADKRHDNNSRCGTDNGWIGATLVLDRTDILNSPMDK